MGCGYGWVGLHVSVECEDHTGLLVHIEGSGTAVSQIGRSGHGVATEASVSGRSMRRGHVAPRYGTGLREHRHVRCVREAGHGRHGRCRHRKGNSSGTRRHNVTALAMSTELCSAPVALPLALVLLLRATTWRGVRPREDRQSATLIYQTRCSPVSWPAGSPGPGSIAPVDKRDGDTH